MKHLMAAGLLVLALNSKAQDSTRVDLHLAGVELQKAAWCQETAAWWLLFGNAFTFVASRPQNLDDGENVAIGIGALTLAGTVTFGILSAKHNKRAARLLL